MRQIVAHGREIPEPFFGSRGGGDREELLDAFLSCIAEKGLTGSTFADVGERAGLSAPESFRRFEGFDDLMLQALEAGLEAFQSHLEELCIEGGTVAERLECLAKVVADFYDGPGYPALLQLELDLTRNPATADRARTIVAGAAWAADPALSQLVDKVFEGAVPPSQEFSRYVSSSVRALARSHALDRSSVGKAHDLLCPDQLLQRRWMVKGLWAVYRDLSVGKVPPPRLGP